MRCESHRAISALAGLALSRKESRGNEQKSRKSLSRKEPEQKSRQSLSRKDERLRCPGLPVPREFLEEKERRKRGGRGREKKRRGGGSTRVLILVRVDVECTNNTRYR